MNGALFFASKYGSTGQYARWIGEATGLPLFDVHDRTADLARYDFLVLGCPVIYHKLMFRKWVRRNLKRLEGKPIILFTVSGAPAGAKLDGWIADSLPPDLIARMHHVALRGRQNPKDLSWFDRIMLIIGGLKNRDRVAGKQELQGFDFMNKSSIAPIVALVEEFNSEERTKREVN